MTPIASMVKELLEKGVAHDAIIIAVEGAERAMVSTVSGGIPVDKAAEKRREYDRNRKRGVRGIPPESTGIPPDVQNASLSKEEKIESKIQERGTTQRKFRGMRLPEDWAPSAIDHAISLEMLGPDRSKSELEKYRDHWKQQPGSKGVKLDWDAAWRNWIRRSAEFRGGKNGHRTNHAGNGPAGGSFFDGLRELAADIAGDAPAPGAGSAEIPRGRFEIDG